MQNFIATLKSKLAQPLPGREAQYAMAHAVRQSYVPPPEHARMAGVLLLLYPRSADWHVVMIQRTSNNPRDRHGGQISFPGGKHEAGDGLLVNTALRETEEEIGVNSREVKIIGDLTDLYIPVSNFLVHPFVGYLDYMPQFIPEAKEVQKVLEVPFQLFQDPNNVHKVDMQLRDNLILREVPCFKVAEHIVWGATAMIMGEFLAIARTVD